MRNITSANLTQNILDFKSFEFEIFRDSHNNSGYFYLQASQLRSCCVTFTVPVPPFLPAKPQRRDIESWRPGETPHQPPFSRHKVSYGS